MWDESLYRWQNTEIRSVQTGIPSMNSIKPREQQAHRDLAVFPEFMAAGATAL